MSDWHASLPLPLRIPGAALAPGAGREAQGQAPRSPARSPPPAERQEQHEDQESDRSWDPEDAAWGGDGDLDGLAPLEVEVDVEPQPQLGGVRLVQVSGLFDQLKVVFRHPQHCTGGDMKYSR